jgi:uroporphyrinogen decarboxylase
MGNRPNHWPKPSPDYHRLVATLQRKGNPSHVPFLELFADREVIAAYFNEQVITYAACTKDRVIFKRHLDQKIRFWYELGYDAIWQWPIVNEPAANQLTSVDKSIYPKEMRDWVDHTNGVVTSWDDIEKIHWPTPQEVDYWPLEYVASQLPEGMGMILDIRGIMEFLMGLMGYETLAVSLYDQPNLVTAMLDKYAEIYIPVMQTMVDMDGVIAVWMGDDMGYYSGPLISPRHLREYVFPMQQKVVGIAKESGLPFLLHTCGNLDVIMEDLIDRVGIDAKHSFEDKIQPVEEFCKLYGDQVAVIGGVDMDLLSRGTEEQVRNRVRDILNTCGYSGGYILGSGNTIANYVPLTNFFAMLDEGHRFNQHNL